MKWTRFTALFAVPLLTLAVQPQVAFATSTYDSLVEVGTTLTIGGGPCSTEDISSSWVEMIHDSNIPYVGGSSARTTARSAFDAVFENGVGWSLVQQTSYDTHILNYVSVVITPSGNSATFHTYTGYPGDHQYLRVPNSLTIDIYKDGYESGCPTKVYFSASSTERVLAQPLDLPHCYGGFCDKRQPVLVNNPVTYPDGYDGTRFTLKQYVAMGDSFSSGEGNSPYEVPTGVESGSEKNICHRSSVAYPRRLQANIGLGLGLTRFVACAGATTANVLNGGSGIGSWGEGPQVAALSSDTDIVTITIGGNDAAFQEYMIACMVSVCGPGTTDYAAVMDIINSTSFLSNLQTVYEEILSEAPGAVVYVIDYPYLTSDDVSGCNGIDASGAHSVQLSLNTSIALAVATVRGESTDFSTRLHYVSSNDSGSPFEGHYMCGENEGSDFGWPSFHPNQSGHRHYAELVTSAIG